MTAYLAGASVYDLAEYYGVHRQTIANVLERANTPRRYNRLTADQLAEAHRLKQSGWTVVQLAEHFDLPASTVQYNLAKYRRAKRELAD